MAVRLNAHITPIDSALLGAQSRGVLFTRTSRKQLKPISARAALPPSPSRDGWRIQLRGGGCGDRPRPLACLVSARNSLPPPVCQYRANDFWTKGESAMAFPTSSLFHG